jgi:hypothetical protein
VQLACVVLNKYYEARVGIWMDKFLLVSVEGRKHFRIPGFLVSSSGHRSCHRSHGAILRVRLGRADPGGSVDSDKTPFRRIFHTFERPVAKLVPSLIFVRSFTGDVDRAITGNVSRCSCLWHWLLWGFQTLADSPNRSDIRKHGCSTVWIDGGNRFWSRYLLQERTYSHLSRSSHHKRRRHM